MKPFSAWVSEMAGTIEDTSVVHKKDDISWAYTPLQKRYLISMELLGAPTTEDEVVSWLEVFCVMYNHTSDRVESGYISQILGIEESELYFNTKGDEESVRWWKYFCNKVIQGKI